MSSRLVYPRHKIIIETPYFVCSEAIAPYLKTVFEGEYDIPLMYADEPPVIIDCGANYGSFSVWASHRWPGCTIHAYEPHEKTHETLKKNLANYPKVHTYQKAVGTPGMRILLDGPNNTGESSLHVQATQVNFTGSHVEVVDPLTLPEAHILKMDIEGCEVEVLEPLLKAGRKFDAVMFEYHRKSDRRTLDALLEDYTLTGAYLYSPGLGVMRYLRKDLLP